MTDDREALLHPESAWSELVDEACRSEGWLESARAPQTFLVYDDLPELALAIADDVALTPEQLAALEIVRGDAEARHLLEETVEVLREAGVPTAPRLRLISDDEPGIHPPDEQDDAMTWSPMPNTMPPVRMGHSTLALAGVSALAAAAAVALFAWLQPAAMSAPVPAPVPAVAAAPAPVIIPTPVMIECEPSEDAAPGETEVAEASTDVMPDAEDTLATLSEAEIRSYASRTRSALAKQGPDKNAELIDTLLKQARKSIFKDPRKAYALASFANELRASQESQRLMAFAACRSRDEARARAAIAKVMGPERATVLESCRRNGIDVE
jgi:hypothetical protein